ncbi:MAG: carboxypeptidase regulatory-like domain-containing protein, partial [Coriobacteriia bacterium]|nr:carboxypeptidase regulatory-like domain-containing protein [Coriobacteriia bacterium]
MKALERIPEAGGFRRLALLLAIVMAVAGLPLQASGVVPPPDVSGVVTDDVGSPLVGASVYIYEYVAKDTGGGSWVKVAATSTDGSGAYQFSELEEQPYIAKFDADGYWPEFYDNAGSAADATLVLFAGTLVDGVDGSLCPQDPCISGKVTEDSTSTPVPLNDIKAKVYKYNGYGSYEYYTCAWTDSNGEYSVYELPAGTYRIWFYDYADKYLKEYWDDKAELALADDIVFNGTDEVASIDASLTPKAAAVSGTVRDDDTGDPIEGAKVVLEPKSAVAGGAIACSGYAYTDAYGRYRIYGLANGSYSVQFLDEDYSDGAYRSEFYNDKESAATADAVTYAGAPVASIDASLAPLAAAITGRVTDESTPTPKPLEGIKAKVFEYAGGGCYEYLTYAWTNADGEYTVYGLEPGLYRIWFYDYEGDYVKEYYNDKESLSEADDINYDGMTTTAGVDAALKGGPRVSGKTRYSTAVEIAREGFPGWEGIDTVILASGDDRAAADPLAASGLCWLYDAPLFLVSERYTPSEVLGAVRDIVGVNGPVKMRVVGGPVSVPSARANEIKNYVDGYFGQAGLVQWSRVTDTGGRYYLARKIAEEMKANAAYQGKTLPGAALIANGADYTKFFDALAMSPVAAQNGTPVLLVSVTEVPGDTAAALSMLKGAGVTETIIGGGPYTVGDGVAKKLSGMGFAVDRWYGRSRYDTAVDIAREAQARGWLDDRVAGVAAALPDALAGGSMIGLHKGVLLLSKPTELPPSTAWWLDTHGSNVDNCYLFGGPNSV